MQPGKDNKPFTIKFSDTTWINKGNIISTGKVQMKVLKVYKKVWWRRLLLWLGFRVKLMDCIKVKYHE